MAKLVTSVLTLCFTLTALLSAQPLTTPPPRITVGRTDRPPQIDGQLTDRCWENAARIDHFVELDLARLAPVQTNARLCWDDTSLYVAVDCDEPNMKGLRAFIDKRDGGVWRDDCVELFLDPGRTRTGFRQIISNAIGTVFDRAVPGTPDWDAQATVAAARSDSSWSVEFAIPFASLDGTPDVGTVWGFNIGRERYAGGGGELSAWSATFAKFDEPARYGELIFAEAPARVTVELPDTIGFGPNTFTVQSIAGTTPDAHLITTWPDATPRAWNPATARVAPAAGKPGRWTVTAPVLDGSEKALVIEAPASEQVAFRAVIPLSISPAPSIDLLARHVIALEQRLADAGPDFARSMTAKIEHARKLLDDFIAQNLARTEPMPPEEWAKQAGAQKSMLSQLTGLAYVVWTQSPWLDLGRTQMPPSLDQTPLITLTACVNEIESAVLNVSNLSDTLLDGRIKLSDLQLAARAEDGLGQKPNMLGNGNFDQPAGLDKPPAHWQKTALTGASVVREQGDDGKPVLALSGSGAGLAVFRQSVKLIPGETYTLEAELSAQGLPPESAFIHVINKGWTWSKTLKPYGPNSAAMRYTLAFTAPDSTYFQVVIRLVNPGGGVFRVHALRLIEGGSDAARFSSACIDAHDVLFQNLRVGKTVADALPVMNGARRLAIPPGETRQVWFKVHTRNLPPGDYTASITFSPFSPELPHKSAPLRLTVLPLHLPEHMPVATFNWDYARNENYVQDLAEHRTNSFLMGTHFPTSFDEDGTLKTPVDWSSYDRMLQVKLRYARSQGGIVLFSYGIIRDFHRRYGPLYGWEFMDATWQKAFRAHVLEFERHVTRDLGMNYDEFAVQLWDEATHKNAELTVQAGTFMRTFAPRIRTCMDGAQDLEEIKALDPVVDLWIPHQTTLYSHKQARQIRKLYKEIMARGEPVWTYTCSTDMKALDPLDYYRLKEWRVYQLGLQGSCYWAYNSWRGDPWNDFDGEIADCGSIYDGPEKPVTSRRWEATLEGREDLCCLHLLQKTARNMPDDERKKALETIDNIVNDALENPKDPNTFKACRARLIEQLQRGPAANPPAFVQPPVIDRNATTTALRAQTNAPVRLTVAYRVPGDAEWRRKTTALSDSFDIQLADLPPGRDVEWYAVGVDADGRVCASLAGLQNHR